MWEGPASGTVKERLLEREDMNLEILHALNRLITHWVNKRNVLFAVTFLLEISVLVLIYIYAPGRYAFIQSDLQCVQAGLFLFFNQCVHSLRIEPVTLVLLGSLLYQLNYWNTSLSVLCNL